MKLTFDLEISVVVEAVECLMQLFSELDLFGLSGRFELSFFLELEEESDFEVIVAFEVAVLRRLKYR